MSSSYTNHYRLFFVQRMFALFTILWLAGCVQTSVANQPLVNISIAGSTAFFPALFDLTEAFSQRYPNVVFDVRGGGSAFGEAQLRQGKIDLAAMTYLAASDAPANTRVEEATEGATAEQATGRIPQSSGHETDSDSVNRLVRIPIGLDGVAMIVHQNNRVGNLSLTELRDIYSGRLFDWKELGGTPGEILLVIREDGSGALNLFESRVMGDEQVSLTAVIMPTNEDVLQYVALHPTAIGYISRSYVLNYNPVPTENETDNIALASSVDEASLSDGALRGDIVSNAYLNSIASERNLVRAVTIDEQLPTQARILNQQYYLVHPLYLVSSNEPSGWLSIFVDFVLSPSGQEIVARYHAPVR